MEGLEQLRHRGDAELLMEEHGPPGAEPGHIEKGPHPSRDPGPEIVELVERAPLEQLVHLGGDRPPNVGDAEQTVIVQRIDVSGVPVHRSSRLLVRPGLIGLATRDGDQIGVLLEPRRHSRVGASHALIITTRASAGTPLGRSAGQIYPVMDR
jgi:hypothetical protein